ncbi:uncharacterized protein LOC120452845 isoform X1 [Drosophila santomea]|uniref:uncharacterized protein LOC120452845 isoform X1 n=1 Tax=Drosophila santomea TaxID=129105 RepID=UPI0019530A06|nr:uncharacterized protein LOC120452845 isoform X1 [Drosophila santomea]
MLESERNRLLLASCYMAHDRTAPPEELSSMVEAMGADANAHHCVWGSPDINDREETVISGLGPLSSGSYFAEPFFPFFKRQFSRNYFTFVL